MFNNMTIEKVVLNEVDSIAGATFLKTFARNNQSEMNIVEVDGEFYIVKKGKSRLLNAKTILDIVEKSLVGKTILEVNSNVKLKLLIQELNLIGEITLKSKVEEDLELF